MYLKLLDVKLTHLTHKEKLLGVPCVKRAWFLVWRIECLVLRTSIQNVNLLVLRVFVPNVMKFTNLSELSVRTEIQSLTVPRTRTMMMTVWNAKKIILNI